MSDTTRIASFRERLRRGDRLVGTFVKTPHPHVVEVLALSPLDCLCLDAEHAPFDRRDLDLCVLAARAADMPLIIRVPDAAPATLLNALDIGATAVLVPHVASAAMAAEIAAACRYGSHGRGYAGSTRAARYTTTPMQTHIERANKQVAVIAQIEDAAAVEKIDAIAAVEGIDAFFVGRMDLTVSMGAASPDAPAVVAAVQRVCDAARAHHRACGMFTSTVEEARRWLGQGAAFFLLGSDQQWMLQGARALADQMR